MGPKLVQKIVVKFSKQLKLRIFYVKTSPVPEIYVQSVKNELPKFVEIYGKYPH